MTETNKNPWPTGIKQTIVFIADCSNKREMKLISSYITKFQPSGSKYEVVYRPLRNTALHSLRKGEANTQTAF
jgi:hypothetical protein